MVCVPADLPLTGVPVTAVDVDALEAARAAVYARIVLTTTLDPHAAQHITDDLIALPEIADLFAAVRDRDVLRAAVDEALALADQFESDARHLVGGEPYAQAAEDLRAALAAGDPS